MRNQPICEIQSRDVAVLMWPSDYPRRAGKRLEEDGLIVWVSDHEEYERTKAGEVKVDEILTRHGMGRRHFADGTRYFVEGTFLHCGDLLEILLRDGSWLQVRFEIAYTDGRRQPVFYLATASGPSLLCRFEGALESGLFRLVDRPVDAAREEQVAC